MSASKASKVLFLVSLLLQLGACSSGMEDLERYVSEVKQRPADPVEPIPPINTYDPFIYSVVDFRDPFISISTENDSGDSEDGSPDGPAPVKDRVKEYLERYSLDTLSMVGTFGNAEDSWVLIRDPDGVIHRVALDNYLGQNHGRVTGIHPDRVEISELIADGGGGWLERGASIAIEE